MQSFEWDSNFETGQKDVDLQHKNLIGLINDFGSQLVENNIIFEDIREIIHQLTNYTQYHFSEEERLMRDVGLDIRHIAHHIKAHHNFLQQVTLMNSGITPDNPSTAKYLFDFLTNWLAFHILGQDQNMSRQIYAIESGLSASLAYEAEEKKHDKSTKPLVKALHGLFEQVSLRNKELIQLNETLEQKVEKRTKDLYTANKKLKIISYTDVLTGLPNRRYVIKSLKAFWFQSKQQETPLACMMIDADHFKHVNDTYGHDAGDKVLQELAKTLVDSLRTDDVVSRLGGDEFFIVCPETDLEGALHIAEITHKKVSKLSVPTGGEPWKGSISIGVAVRTPNMKSYEDLIKAADKGVYSAKNDGKNCIRTVIEQ